MDSNSNRQQDTLKKKRFYLSMALALALLLTFLLGAPVARAGSTTLVINEVDYDQPGTDTAEFLELKNVSASPINLDNYTVELVNGSSGGAAVYNTIDLPNVDLAAGAYYVICANTANTANCDLDVTPDTDLIQNGAPDAIGLRLNGELVDAVSYEGNTGAPYTEGSGVGLLDDPGPSNMGLSRCSDGNDTDQNNADFLFRAVTPGSANDCPSVGGELVINELDYDQPGTDTAEFIELKNLGPGTENLDNYTVELVNGNGGGAAVYNTIDLPNVDLAAGDYYVICANAANTANCDLDVTPDTDLIQNGAPDAVGLRLNGDLVDAVSYEGNTGAPYTEGSGVGLLDDPGPSGMGLSRCPDGNDTNQNNADFLFKDITPGAANICVSVGGKLVINELDYDQPGTDTAEFLELVNLGPGTENLDNYTVELVNGNGGGAAVYNTIDLPNVDLAAGDYYVICANAANTTNCDLDVTPDTDLIQNGAPDAVGLRLNGDLVDAVSYEGNTGAPYTEGSGVGLLDDPGPSNMGLSRCPDGNDTDQNNADFDFSLITPGAANNCEPEPPALTLSIHDIQGAAHLSPYVGQSVIISPSIVTSVRFNGFNIQEPNPDDDDATSEAIFVFTDSAPTVAVGDEVTVSGTVAEFRPGGATGNNLTITEISGPSVVVHSSGNPLPAATIIGIGGRIPPTAVIDDDATGDVEVSGTFDEATDGIDFYESLEHMYVQINNALIVGPTNNFGEIPVVPDNGANASLLTPRGGIIIQPGDFNPERIILDDVIATNEPGVNTGDSFAGPLVGVLDYSFGNFKFLPHSWPAVVSGGLVREVATAAGPGELAVATFNVENLDPGDDSAKFEALANLIVNHLQSPDIIAVEEIQDNSGPISDTVVAADVTFTSLIEFIQDAGGPTYDYRQIDPVNGMDGGEPGGNIRVGFLFRTDRGVAFVDRPGAGSTTPNSVLGSGDTTQLEYSPGRIDPTNPAFNASRKPLAGEFTFMGQTIFVIANHFNSKGGDDPLFGRYQPPTLFSEVQRIQQAQVVNDFVDDILAADPDANVIVLGDINDFWFSNPMAALTDGGVLTPLITTLPANERYTYVFDGNSQDLDHILVSPNLLNNVPFVYDSVHVNAEFDEQDSDHDPQLIIFDFNVGGNATLTGFTADGYTTITLDYEGTVPFTADIYVSYNGVSQDILLDTVIVTDPDGSQDFTLGVDINLIDTASEDLDVDYYLLADASGSTVLFEGAYQRPAQPVFVHGTDAADTITAAGSNVNNFTVNYNGTPLNYTSGRGLRIRAHGDDDTVSLAGITFSTTNFKPFIAGGPGADSLTGGNTDDTFLGGAGNDTINGGNQPDTTSYADSPAAVTVDLAAGTASDGYGDTDTLTNISNAYGSIYNDTLIGDATNNILGGNAGDDMLDGQRGNDRLVGGAGNDILNGSLGNDTAAYADSPAAVTADISAGTASDGFGTTDTFISIENLDGSPYNDTLIGDSGPNVINGQNGNDIIIGGAGADTLQGQRGNDTLYANTPACTSDGAIDKLNGGPNNDTAYYTFTQDIPEAIEIANDCP